MDLEEVMGLQELEQRKKVLVFGGNRFVGKALIEKLLDQGYNVDMFNRSGTGPDYVMDTCEANIIQGDRNNSEDLDKIDFDVYGCIVDMCLFFESQFDLIEDRINEDTNYIFVSSGAANSKYSQNYGDYGHDKKQVERRLQDSKLNYKIVRPSYIVGQGNHRPRLGHYMNKIINREHIEVAGNGQNKVNVVFVQDVVNQLVRLVTTGARTYEMIEVVGDNIEIADLIYKVNEYSREGEVMLVQDDENAVLPEHDFTFETNWDYTKLEEGLKDYAKWYYNEGAEKYGYNI
jgi:nucleoside-diphosphate-sugar epimerase